MIMIPEIEDNNLKSVILLIQFIVVQCASYSFSMILKKTLKAIKKKPSLSRVWCLVNDAAALAL